MNSKLFTYLKAEEDILAKMIENAHKQQRALVNFEYYYIEQLALEQNMLSKTLRNAEELRIRLIMESANLSRMQASTLKLSTLLNYLEHDEALELKRLQKRLKVNLAKLNSINAINKVLGAKALKTTQELLTFFSKGESQLCNAKI